MIITNLKGGLGNQIFQYAFGKHLSIKNNCDLLLCIDNYEKYKLHNGFELQRVFDLNEKICSKKELSLVIGSLNNPILRNIKEKFKLPIFLNKNTFFEKTHEFMNSSSEIKGFTYIHGYWQSEKYFSGSDNELRKLLKFNYDEKNYDSRILNMIRSKESIAVHIRRGDYTSAKNKSIYAQLSSEYYKKAFEHIKNKVENPNLIFFSDDIEWTKKLFFNWPFKKIFIEGNTGLNSFKDLHLMSLCKHQIIANSSFSWWGAWLNNFKGKIIVAPENWYQSKVTRDIYPKDWVRI